MSIEPAIHPLRGGPFDLGDEAAYRRWRERKLENYPAAVGELVVEVADPFSLSAAEHTALLDRCRRANMAVYAGNPRKINDKEAVRALGRQFGLERLDSNLLADDDGITSLRVVAGEKRGAFIPYTDKPINWHTDGYYNTPEHWIRAMLLHCVQPAAAGGENALMDPEVAYILLRDANPAHVAALMEPDAMTIPPNDEPGADYRGAQGGPVFSVDASGTLHMRYTARKRNIVWKDTPAVRAAVQALEELLGGPSPYIFRHTLASGQGYLCNNVLHTRSRFEDAAGAERLLYRARYFDRMAGTSYHDVYGD